MSALSTWWTRQQWGPLSDITDYRRERILALYERGETVSKPTEQEWRLAGEYLSWERRGLWRNGAVLAALSWLLILIDAVPDRFAVDFAFLMTLSFLLQAWRQVRRRRTFAGHQAKAASCGADRGTSRGPRAAP
jgi:hypothetical protein